MKFKFFLSIFLCLVCFSMVAGVSAAEKTSDDMNDFSHYTIASKIAYAFTWNYFRFYGGYVVPGDMHTLQDIADYFNQNTSRSAYVVNVTSDELQVGDLVHVKNSDYPFMIYKGYNTITRNSSDAEQIVLESLLGRYVCEVDTFNQIYDGYAIKFPDGDDETAFAQSHVIDGSNIDDSPIYDPNIADSPGFINDSLFVTFWNNHQFDPDSDDSQQLKRFEATLLNGSTSDSDKAQRIFTWVRDNVGYSGKYVGTTWYSSFAINSNESGNSCDHARLVYALSKLAGLDAMFHKAYNRFPNGNFTHVWVDIKVNGTWMSADTTSKQNQLGNTTYSHIIQDYGRFDMLDC